MTGIQDLVPNRDCEGAARPSDPAAIPGRHGVQSFARALLKALRGHPPDSFRNAGAPRWDVSPDGKRFLLMGEIPRCGACSFSQRRSPVQTTVTGGDGAAPAVAIDVLQITPGVAGASVRLAALPGDPADRLIAATAPYHDLTLLTADERILAWADVRGSGGRDRRPRSAGLNA